MAGILRSPPWPGMVAEAVSLDEGPESGDFDLAAARAVAKVMAEQRVGGRFWGRQVEGRRRLVVVGAGEEASGVDFGQSVVIAPRASCRRAAAQGALVIGDDVDPWPLIEAAEEVVCQPFTEMAVLALAAGKRVVSLDGRPLDDEGGALFVRTLLGRRYRDPIGGGALDAAEAIALLGRWRALIDANRGVVAATGMAFWKRREVARLLWDGRVDKLPFLRPAAAIAKAKRKGGAVAAWPARAGVEFADRARAAGVRVRWVEDGFLRSAGLGSDLLPPLSLIVDELWPYFDPARPSRLEHLLETAMFGEVLLSRAVALRATIVARRIGKYHIGGSAAAPHVPTGKRLVLVVGQVEDDLSVKHGGGGMTNLSLLERVREAEPDAYIVYRPHPDVEAGHRRGAIADAVTLTIVNDVDRGGSLDAWLTRADTVHTLTSLTGFEALMRGVRVVVHGAPFYAGWGLTDDRGPPLTRRTRRLTIDQLVAGALILYPRYLDPRHGLPCTPEQFIGGFGGGVHAGWLVRLRRWQGRLRRAFG